MKVRTRHCLYAAHSPWSQQCVYVQRCAHSSRCVCSTYMCSAAVLLCVCVWYVFEPAMLPQLPPAFLWYKSLSYAGVYSGVCSTYTCSAAVLLCACVCRIRVRVRTCHTTSPSSSAPAVQMPSITCVDYASSPMYVVYAAPATYGCASSNMCLCLSHVTPACNVTHAHIVITPCGLPRQILLFPSQGTKYEHHIGDILRLKAKVAD